jgi:hypothetical protein
MKKRLNENILVPGDIVVTTTDAVISRKIRAATLSKVSHAMLYVTHSSVIHAVTEGVHAENTQRIFFEDDWPVYVLRLKGGLPSDQAQKICDYVRGVVGTEYTSREAIRAVAGSGRRFSAKQYCSRLVAQAYDKHGYKLVPNPNYCTPAALLKSNMLEQVQNGTSVVSEEEYAFWQQDAPSSPDATREATNQILNWIRNIDPTVQNFGDIGRFLFQHPEHDFAVNSLLHSTGYLDIWKLDYSAHPWRWDLSAMEQLAAVNPSSIKRYCLATMKAEPRDDNRFTKNLAALRQNYRAFPRESLKTLIDLYQTLVDLHARRFDTASMWLGKNIISDTS